MVYKNPDINDKLKYEPFSQRMQWKKQDKNNKKQYFYDINVINAELFQHTKYDRSRNKLVMKAYLFLKYSYIGYPKKCALVS